MNYEKDVLESVDAIEKNFEKLKSRLERYWTNIEDVTFESLVKEMRDEIVRVDDDIYEVLLKIKVFEKRLERMEDSLHKQQKQIENVMKGAHVVVNTMAQQFNGGSR